MTDISGTGRICVVTPYYKEERALLERCLASVARQGASVDHMLVADGFPQAWIDDLAVRHIRLDRPHGDYGNAARGAGALLAVAEGYDAVAFLDADNWYDDDHLASCLEAAAAEPDAAYVIAQRRFCRPDCSVIVGTPSDVPHSEHVDTNCYLLLPPTFPLLHRWCTLPKELAPYGDQVFGRILRAAGLASALVPRRTVNYLCLTDSIYRQRREAPPPGCKPMISWSDAQRWIYGLSPAGQRGLERSTGLSLSALDPHRAAYDGMDVTSLHVAVEIPGSTQSGRLRRTPGDLAEYRRVFLDGALRAVDLPADVSLVVDAAAGVGLAALDLHVRYPGATVVAVEPDADAFATLAENMAGRQGCSVLRARVVSAGADRGDADGAIANASCPELPLATLLRRLDAPVVDILRLSPDQYQALVADDVTCLDRVRLVLVDGAAGSVLIDPAALLADRLTPGPSVPRPPDAQADALAA